VNREVNRRASASASAPITPTIRANTGRRGVPATQRRGRAATSSIATRHAGHTCWRRLTSSRATRLSARAQDIVAR
jgi:hypothetical protein